LGCKILVYNFFGIIAFVKRRYNSAIRKPRYTKVVTNASPQNIMTVRGSPLPLYFPGSLPNFTKLIMARTKAAKISNPALFKIGASRKEAPKKIIEARP
jgi:hypothetical protein